MNENDQEGQDRSALRSAAVPRDVYIRPLPARLAIDKLGSWHLGSGTSGRLYLRMSLDDFSRYRR